MAEAVDVDNFKNASRSYGWQEVYNSGIAIKGKVREPDKAFLFWPQVVFASSDGKGLHCLLDPSSFEDYLTLKATDSAVVVSRWIQ